MIIQGNRKTGWLARHVLLLIGLPTAVALSAVACSEAVRIQPSPDLSDLTPTGVLAEFLESEHQKGSVKFVFSGDIQVRNGSSHHFQGVSAYKSCSALRIKLLGPLGFTLLEYIYADHQARLLVNQVTPKDDEPALEGLLQLMELFTLALIDRCQTIPEFNYQSHDTHSVIFTVPTRTGGLMTLSLDQNKGVVTRQFINGGTFPDTAIDFKDYRWTDGYWMPGLIEVRGKTLPVSIVLEIREWSIDVDLPDGFFTLTQ